MLVWQGYRTDLDRTYPMFALSLSQLNNVSSNIDPVSLLPQAIASQLIENKYPCGVEGLTPRYLILWDSNGAQWRLNYPQPFSQNLFDFLTLNTSVAAFEFVGERLKYGRLKRLLDYVRP